MHIVIYDDMVQTVQDIKEILTDLGHKIKVFDEVDDRLFNYLQENHGSIDVFFIDEDADIPSFLKDYEKRVTEECQFKELGRPLGRALGLYLTEQYFEIDRYIPRVLLTQHNELGLAVDAISMCGYDYFLFKKEFARDAQSYLDMMLKVPSIKNKLQSRRDYLESEKRYDAIKEASNYLAYPHFLLTCMEKTYELFEDNIKKVNKTLLNCSRLVIAKLVEEEFSMKMTQLSNSNNKKFTDEHLVSIINFVEHLSKNTEIQDKTNQSIIGKIRDVKPDNVLSNYLSSLEREEISDGKSRIKKCFKQLLTENPTKWKHTRTLQPTIKYIDEM